MIVKLSYLNSPNLLTNIVLHTFIQIAIIFIEQLLIR